MSQAPKTKSRLTTIVLVLSIAVNLAIIGLLAGGALRGMPHRHDGRALQPDFRALWRALPDDVRETLRAQDDHHGRDRQQTARAGREGRAARAEARRRGAVAMNRDIVRLLRAEPFDAGAFEDVLNRERQSLESRLRRMRRGFVEQLETMTPAQRLEMAAELEETWRARGVYDPEAEQ